jgi:hypothetical protein
MKRRLSKKSEKAIKKVIEERLFEHPSRSIGISSRDRARACPKLDSGMMLQVAMPACR